MDDPRSVLGVAADATAAEIRAAFRRLARIHHPDRFATAPPGIQRRAQRRMCDLNLAYRLIGPRSEPPKEEKVTSAYAARMSREDAIRQATYRRWDVAERRAKQRWERESEEAARATESADAPPPPAPPPPDPRTVMGGDGGKLGGPDMVLRRMERLRAAKAASRVG